MQLVVGYTFDGPRKVDLPESILAEVSQDAIESPLIFSLADPSSKLITHVGVREFSASPDTIGLSTSLAKELDVEIGSCVQLERKSLSKGTEVSLKVDVASSIDWKALLERWLPQNVTALTVGDRFNIKHLGQTYTLEVMKLEPDQAVDVTDTDMDLIIESPAELSSSETRAVTLGTEFQLIQGETVNIPVENIDKLFVSVDGVVYLGPEHATSQQSYLYCFTGKGEHSVPTLGDVISICGEATVTVNDHAASEPTEGKQCTNCGKVVPEQSFVLHSNFCLRHTTKCQDCGEVFSGTSKIPSDHWHCDMCGEHGTGYEKIHQAQHKPESCECGTYKTHHGDVARHRASECPNRLVTCQFCHLLLPQGEASSSARAQGLTGHEDECGGRTADCPYCQKHVRIRSLAAHIAQHDAVRRERIAPELCSNQDCPQPRDDPSIPLGLCKHCFGPLYNSQNDPDGKLLASRVERRYILQMTRGCGKSWCQNPYCFSGSGKKRTVGECMATIKEISATGQHWFCVDETRARKAMFVNVADESPFARGWRGMAITRCGSEAEAERWLELNASKIYEQKPF